MATLTIKGLPDGLYERLRRRAADQRRSINREAILCLEQALQEPRPDPAEILARADALRVRLKVPPLTDDFIREARDEGRP